MARAAGLGEAALQRIHFAALLHDLGMLKLDRNQPMTRAMHRDPSTTRNAG